MTGKAPGGFYTVVEAIVRLANGRSYNYQWTTPLALARALHKAPSWAKQELKMAHVKGRTRITGWAIEARLQHGRFKR